MLSVGLVGGEIVPFKFFPDIDGEVTRVDVRLPSGSPPEATEAVRDALEASAQQAIAGMENAGVVGMYTRMGQLAPTAAVAFTINHIAAVFLPALLGYLWIVSPGGVFIMAAGMAATSLALALMIPRHPEPGHETVFSRPLAAPAE